MKLISLVLALGMVSPSKSRARTRTDGAPEGTIPPPRTRPPIKQSRRHVARQIGQIAQIAPLRSPCGRHLVEIDGGAVLIDGRRVHPRLGSVEVLMPPSWRADGGALAWLERGEGETRLVVIPALDEEGPPLAWPLPGNLARERLHWVASNRVVIGPEALQPRAVASWD